jgi:hypothetical protein
MVCYYYYCSSSSSFSSFLTGETICPVGMHTKDKSKAAAALVSRPDKLVSLILFVIEFDYRPSCVSTM